MLGHEFVNGGKERARVWLLPLTTEEPNEVHHGGLLFRGERGDELGEGLGGHSVTSEQSIHRRETKAKGPDAKATSP